MSRTEHEVERGKKSYDDERKRLEVMRKTSHANAPNQHEKRVDRYIEKERAEREGESKQVEVNKTLREG